MQTYKNRKRINDLMKHTLSVTFALIGFFLLTQFVGLAVISHYIDIKRTAETQALEWKELPFNIERPEVKDQSTSFIPIFIAIIVGTLLILWFARIKKPLLWRIWFFFTVLATLSIAFSAFVRQEIAFAVALALTSLRLLRPNTLTQNISEIFIYGGLASIFVPILNKFAAIMLLIIISIYDIIAVWKTKHMVKLAEFQQSSRVFSGLMISYKRKEQSGMFKAKPAKGMKPKAGIAVLGGGDMGFPLIFAGVVMKGLMLKETMLAGFLKASIIPITTAIALLILLMKGQRNRYYPAMPFLSLGCLVGYGIVLLF